MGPAKIKGRWARRSPKGIQTISESIGEAVGAEKFFISADQKIAVLSVNFY
jgi:hypothetical protein